MKKLKLSLVAVAACALLAAGLTLVGCSSAPDPKEAIEKDLTVQLESITNPSQEDIDDMVASLGSYEEVATFGIDGVAYMNSLLDGFAYAIDSIDVAEDGKTATVNVTVTCKSVDSAIAKMQEITDTWVAENLESIATMTEDKINLKTGELLMQAVDECDMTTSQIQFDYSLVDNAWTIDENAEDRLLNAFYA